MNILFWSIIALMTLTAASGLAWPVFNNRTVHVNIAVKLGLVALPVLALGAYCWLGNSRQLQQFWQWQHQEIQVQQQMAQLKNPQQLITRLRDHLRQSPNSAEGWYLLGKLYLDQQQYPQAEETLSRAHQLKPQAGEITVELAKANFFTHGQHLTPAMEATLTNVLEFLPEPVDALNLLAVNAYRRKDFHQAVGLWQRALALVPPDSPDSRALLNMIGKAQKQETDKNGR